MSDTSPAYVEGKIVAKRSLTPSIKEFDVRAAGLVPPMPGQFAMLWIPRVGEIPLSFADYSGGVAKFIVSRVGRVTTYMHQELGEGSAVYIRGPYGRGFSLRSSGRCLLVGGGYGLAPLYYLGKTLKARGCSLEILLGFRNSKETFYVEEFGELGDVEYSTEDGGGGFKGTVVELLQNKFEDSAYDIVYACGKEAMLVKVVEECVKRGVEVEVSLERLIKCSLGVCGACSVEPLGLRVCRDGPVFDGSILMSLKESVAGDVQVGRCPEITVRPPGAREGVGRGKSPGDRSLG